MTTHTLGATTPGTSTSTSTSTSFLWLEITGKCQLRCIHCYADSGPDGEHGPMTTADWERVLAEAAKLGIGNVQFIGGEPTLREDLDELIRAALGRGLAVEVFSNLVHVKPHLWETFQLPGVSLATSWYSDDPGQHRRITQRPSHSRTAANIAEARRLGIDLRVGLVDILDEQRVAEARRALTGLGVAPERVRTDRFRQFGRGREPEVSELCGRCGDGVAAIGPHGQVWPCIMARWIVAGNVRTAPLAELLEAAKVPEFSRPSQARDQCGPEGCGPHCNPASTCRPVDGPCDPTMKRWTALTERCDPDGDCTPGYGGSGCSPRT